MWSMDYVQVPIEKPEKKMEEPTVIVEKEITKEKKKVDLVKQMSINTDGLPGKIYKTQLTNLS